MASRWQLLMALPALAASAGLGAQATDVPSLLELEPAANPIGVVITADHGDRRYALGEAVAISVTPAEDAYVYLFNIDATGTVTQLVPNAHAAAGLVRAGERQVYPDVDAPWQIVADKRGTETIKVIVTKTPSEFAERSETFEAGPFKVFRRTGDELANLLRASVAPAGARWGTASLTITVGEAGGAKAPPALTEAELKPRSGPLDRLPSTLPPPPVIIPSLF